MGQVWTHEVALMERSDSTWLDFDEDVKEIEWGTVSRMAFQPPVH